MDDRPSSPSPSVSPTPAISSCPSPDRTFSSISSLSISSATSADARSSVSISGRRRGYIRPQGAEFAESAKNRESVMSLGSIAHLQYYFARTGLLDGKGGHAREYKKSPKAENVPRLLLTPNSRFIEEDGEDNGELLVESPTDEGGLEPDCDSDGYEVMLPPTVSTYSIKTHYIPPPPDLRSLRRDLLTALRRAETELEEMDGRTGPSPDLKPPRISLSPDDLPETEEDALRQSAAVAAAAAASTPQGWQEIQGMKILDVVTLAIRAARIYYTAHERPDRLALIKSERDIRQELFNVLEVLKRWAARGFTSGMRADEHDAITGWMADVRGLLARDAQLEEDEVRERESWVWATDEWEGRELEREASFLSSLLEPDQPPLPAWEPVEGRPVPTTLLERLRDGRDLVRMHNIAVKKSKRPFGEIKTFHTDVAKPYRCADNLRFWLKASEIRWETKLDMDVMGVVYGASDEAWRRFDAALLTWCRAVREELVRDWRELRPGTPSDASLPSASPSPVTSTSLSISTTPQLLSSPPTVSISSPGVLLPRRVQSKSSLRSTASSLTDDDWELDSNTAAESSNNTSANNKNLVVFPSILRRLSPGLAARVKLLDGSNKPSTFPVRAINNVGRIPQEHINEIDSAHQNLSIKVQKRGKAWNRVTGQQQGPDETTGGGVEYLEVPDLGPELEVDLDTEEQEEEEGEEEKQQQEEEEEEDACTVDPDPEPEMLVVEMPPVPPEPVTTEPQPELEPETQSETAGQTDFEKYIQSSTQDAENPPPPPPKDTPPLPSSASVRSLSQPQTQASYFNPMGLHRTESIYSFSRVSFSNQLSQLTSITLPQPTSLAASIAAIANAVAAVKALTGAAEQIQYWIRKASDVLSGLDAEDDVEWAAAGGREGLEGVDKAITKFESLVNVYVTAIEEVQLRPDIGQVGPDALTAIVIQMESILQNWSQIKAKLRGVKGHVELAMEWEELWANVLGDVGMEVDNLSGLIFEMEEKRHQTMSADPEPTGGLDINELETIVEETPAHYHPSSHHHHTPSSTKRYSIGTPVAAAAADTPVIQTPQDDSNYTNLMALFARMQPLRASLDFLPMRLSMFQSRAEAIFPSACEELEDRRRQLEQSYKTLETDAEALRKELGEDRWILVFRNAGGQAQKMFDSVERSIGKLQESLESGAHLNNQAALAKRIENYEAKKVHYVPAIERVIAIIQKGINDRLTVNGEILSLLADMQSRTDALKASIKVMDSSLEEINFVKPCAAAAVAATPHTHAHHHLRDSISSILTMDSPATAGSVVDTPGSSPASSVIMSTAGTGMKKGAATPMGNSSRRDSSASSTTRSTPALAKVRRLSGIPQPATATTTKTIRKTSLPVPFSSSGGLQSPPATRTRSAVTPTPMAKKPVRPLATPQQPPSNRPRWNGSVNTGDLEVGHIYRPSSSLPTPPAFRKSSAPSRLSRPPSTLPVRSPMHQRNPSTSPAPGGPATSVRAASRVSSRLTSRSPARTASPTPTATPTRSLLDPPPYSKLGIRSISTATPGPGRMANVPRSRQSFAGIPASSKMAAKENDPSLLLSPTKPSARPGTALGHSTTGSSRRTSLLPLPKARSGRESSLGERPPWR
ncbi:hypothetical protein ASPZODRAFT_151408 [Penicilliopsis zonata CBS 506.65]|uniref:GAR domain-containing protein n=1 Tax=Penicilliopsis zonata CBS 506.65 TaxID=1073090 RepID=A0A1L9SLS7_9EURO|nr:hypothetical protein ASPZODRAFT_151408 [Penicilliopsis zonata CBS 506.65]OJJ48004.1 hypothetical protein ASPZODRAFT_151408 [Penicilliopsis zonata CBS 506.65]